MKSFKQWITDMRLAGTLAHLKGRPREYKGDYTPGSAEWLAWFEGYDGVEKPATADRDAALAEMRGLISDLWEEVNPHRLALIVLKIKRTATPDELAELTRLQSLADRMYRIIAPLPIAEMEQLQAEIAEAWEREAKEQS